MSKIIDIEYCGAWGYGGPATRLKDYIKQNYGSEVEVKCHSAGSTTGTIQVSWIKQGALNTVWNKGKLDTTKNHETILGLLKQNEWGSPAVRTIDHEEGSWTLGGHLNPWS
jgi:hypothetical protein